MTIRGLTAQEMLSLWETARPQYPVTLALTILSSVLPELAADQLQHLSIGRRDAYLLAIYEQTFGSHFASLAHCPHCHERLEFAFEATDIRRELLPEPPGERCVSIEGYELHFRLPDSLDLAQLARCRDDNQAYTLLLQRCVGHIEHAGEVVSVGDLPELVLHELAETMAACDPQAEVIFNLNCPVCDQQWMVLFDILTFLWSEISAQAKQLVIEVHTLARAYGWREADILSLSVTRRQCYLEMVI
jgi:hypothetical protein